MAVLTYRVGLQTLLDGNFAGLSESDVAAATRTDGWTSAKLAAAQMAEFDAGTKLSSGSFSSAAKPASFLTGTNANAFKTPQLKGVFANAAWTFTFALRCSTASSQRGRIRMRVFKSKNDDGSSATELTSGTQIGTTVAAALSTSADQTSVVTWNPGAAITLDDEYLFFVIAWEVTTAGGSNSADVLMRTGQAAAGSFFVTPDFAITPPTTTTIDDFNRANGKVTAGVGAGIWNPDYFQPNDIYDCDIESNLLKGSTFQPRLRYMGALNSDFDWMVDCVIAGTTTGINNRMNLFFAADGDGNVSNSYEIRWQADGGLNVFRIVGGSNTQIANLTGVTPPVAGDTVWVQKRGNVFKLYRGAPGAFALVATWTDSANQWNRSGPFAFTIPEPVSRWDNIRASGIATAPTTKLLDDFNRADSPDPGPIYFGSFAANGWQVKNNRLVNLSGVWDGIYIGIAPSTADEEIIVDLAGIGADGSHLQLWLRRDVATDSGYYLDWIAGSPDTAVIMKRTSGVDSTLLTIPFARSYYVDAAVGDRLAFDITGNVIQAWIYRAALGGWDFLGEVRDTSFTQGNPIAIYSNDPGWIIENLYAGPYPITLNVSDSVTLTDYTNGFGPVPVPEKEDIIDDFNRADGLVTQGGPWWSNGWDQWGTNLSESD